ncbi:MAG: hypothetical protein QF599_12865 [Planctomycetota bacterium]|nr:hypothetical protein [Planctomycetota bacterium]
MQHTLKRLIFSISIITSSLVMGVPPATANADAALVGAGSVPQLETAAAQLGHASAVKQSMRGTEEPERSKIRARAVTAYQAVLDYFPADGASCAEAAFRAGELQRAGGDLDGALAAFIRSRQQGAETVFKARSGLEIGHIHRRADSTEKALAAYDDVISDTTAAPGYRDEARLWAGRVWHAKSESSGRLEALRLWEQVAQHGDDPMDKIRAFDYLALDLIDATDLEGAAGMLERCRETLTSVAEEETRLGERVRKSLTRMRAVNALQRAVEKRAQSTEEDNQDAQQVVE